MAWSQEQLQNAKIIAQVGQELGASARDIQIAIMTAIVESNLVNVNYGDRDSLGLFQQRDSWGSAAQRMDPYTSAKMFFQGGTSADGYSEPGLFDKSNRTSMSMGEAAQSVQVSAFPDRYAEHETAASNLLEKVSGMSGVPGTLGAVPTSVDVVDSPTIGEALTETLGGPDAAPVAEVNAVGEWTNPALAEARHSGLGEATNSALSTDGVGAPGTAAGFDTNPLMDWKLPTLDDYDTTDIPGFDGNVGGWRKKVLDFANKMLGVSYVWGGTTVNGVDCSGLLKLAFQKAGIDLPRISADQARAGRRVDLSALKPGDLVAWDNSSRNNGADHIAIYIGGGQIIEAPRPGTSVQVSDIYDQDNAWGVKLNF